MVTIKPALRNRTNKEGKYPLLIRITKNRRTSIQTLGVAIEKKYWNESERKVKKNHPNSVRLNSFIDKKVNELHKIYFEEELKDKSVSAQKIREIAKNPKGELSFFAQAKTYLEILKNEGKYNRAQTDEPRIKRFKSFLKGRDVSFNEVDVNLLKKFKAFAIKEYGVSERTAINYLIVIRTIYNQGIKNGVAEEKNYPFGRNGISVKFPESVKQGLNEEEVKKLSELDLTDKPKHNDARNVWMISFLFAGIRISDVLRLRWSDIQDGRLIYQMGKNKKTLSIKIPDKAADILRSYKSIGSTVNDLVFPYLLNVDNWNDSWLIQRKISYATKTINKYLKKIGEELKLEKKLTTHIARHSFGHIAGDKIPIQTLQKLYRHSDLQTTINYQKSFIHDTDTALEEVVGF